jgi:hypothetical protein
MTDTDSIPLPELPDAPPGARNVLLITLDSLRYDSWIAAAPKNLGRLGQVEKRYSYATWTPPSHYNMLMGLFPHPIPSDVTKADYVKKEFKQHSERFQLDVKEFQRKHIPSMFLPTFLRSVGYHTRAIVSMPVLNAFTAINRDWESYEQMSRHNDMSGMIDKLQFDAERPTFYMLNVGETHYPYTVPDFDSSQWPRVSGLHGAVKNLDDKPGVFDPDPKARRELTLDRLLTLEEMYEARDRQIEACAYVDTLFARLFEVVPSGTYVVVTADHGDLFGEDGMFGHGSVVHQKVLEVPFVEGVVP